MTRLKTAVESVRADQTFECECIFILHAADRLRTGQHKELAADGADALGS